MPKVFDTDIVETSETLGPGTYTLEGPVTGYRSFNEGFDSGDTPYYVVRNQQDTKYEHNRGGVFNGTNTLARGVYLSSNGNAPVSWLAEDHPLIVYQPSAIEIMEDIIKGWRATSKSVWLQFGSWWRADYPTVGKDTLMYRNSSNEDVPLVEVEGNSGYFLNKPPGEYVDVAYPVTPGSEPLGTLIADGAAISRTTFSKLFAKISTGHGAGNGTTTFNKPDARGRNRVARDNQGGTAANVIDNTYYSSGNVQSNGSKGGAKGHTGGVGASVSVSVSGGISGSTFGSLTGGATGFDGSFVAAAVSGSGAAPQSHTHPNVSVTGSLGVTGGFSGSGSGSGATGAFTIMQPGIIVDTLITTGGQ